MKCTCFICGKEFDRKPALIKRAEHPVCSRECQTILKHKGFVETKCCVCGKLLLRRQSRLDIRPNPTCSKACANEVKRRVNIDPDITDEERQQTRKVPERRGFLKAVMDRDDYKCVICGVHENRMIVHHLNGYNWDKENRCNPDNGVTLCNQCHEGFHKRYGKGWNTKDQFIEYANQSGRPGIIPQSHATHRS